MAQGSVEERLTRIEEQVAQLIAASNRNGHQSWIDRVTGSARGDADFAEILRLGKELRDAAEDIEEHLAPPHS